MADDSGIPTPGELATLAERKRRYMARLRQDPAYRDRMRAYLRDYARAHRDEANERNRDYRARHPEVRRRQRYGLAPEHIKAWLEFQGGCCALCGDPLGERFHVDHDHDTGNVRGILHGPCNMRLQDSPSAERYLAGWVA